MIKHLICLIVCLGYIESQSTFPTLSTASTTTTKSTVSTTTAKVTFAPLSTTTAKTTATVSSSTSSTTSTTTATGIVVSECPADVKVFCKNEATCSIINNSNFLCKCKQEFTGIYCETPISQSTVSSSTVSSSTPAISSVACPANIASICKNNGVCTVNNGVNIVCTCQSGFAGPFCETSLFPTTTAVPTTTTSLPCLPNQNPCLNNGQCSLINGGTIKCKCDPAYTGTFCETKAPFCDSDPCENGTCLPLDRFKGFCFCDEKYYGLYCESLGCSPNPCQNNQVCSLNSNNQPVCTCSAPWTGTFCESQI